MNNWTKSAPRPCVCKGKHFRRVDKMRDNRLIISWYANDFERPTLRGCPLTANYDRVVASFQRLPCQKTKPRGLLLQGWTLSDWVGNCFAIIGLFDGKSFDPKSPTHRVLSPTNNPIGVSLLVGQCWHKASTLPRSITNIDNPIGLVFQKQANTRRRTLKVQT